MVILAKKGACISADRGSGGFTLLELLTVVAIIAILLGILSPGLRAARRQVAGVISMSRQKEVASGLLEYAVDYSDRLPQSVATIGTGEYWNWTEPMMLTGYRERSPGLHRSMAEYLREYIPDPRILSCPSAPKPYPNLEQVWKAGDAWDHPETALIQDPVSGNYCLWWSYSGYLSETGKVFMGPSSPSGGGRESHLIMSDYLGYDHWRNPRQFSSCERFEKSEVVAGTLLSSSLWGGKGETDSEPNQLPQIRIRATYLDGHVETYTTEELTGLKVIWKVETGEPYPDGIGPGEFFIPREAIR
ncbi:MAG: type II secretion system protein [Phycisphaerae bacterium]|nr:type II secretion system protein [Phycisphaerae bacterium]